MSRIGKKIISLPEKVSVEVSDGLVLVKGPKGDLNLSLPRGVAVKREGEEIKVELSGNGGSKEMWGTIRSLLSNAVKGVSEGFDKKLEIEGIGYKAQLSGDDLILSLGFSHPVEFKAPKGIAFKVEKNTITVSGIDKALVGEVAASIRKLKKPEPYKGKGIHYAGEVIRRKAGKKATASA